MKNLDNPRATRPREVTISTAMFQNGVVTARDAFGTDNFWGWYWDKKAHINVTRGFFWGEDTISQFFQGISDKYFVPAWSVVHSADIKGATSRTSKSKFVFF